MVLSGIALCPRLWTADRSYPTVPALEGFGSLSQGVTILVSSVFVLAILAVAAFPKSRIPLFVAVVSGVVLVAFDITRLQPWIYQSLLLFAVLAWASDESRALGACQFLFVALYAWSGLSKANVAFETFAFPWLLRPFHLEALKPLWFLAPFFEFSIGMLLAFRRTRLFGLIGAGGMHVFLLIVLGPFGANANSVIWPWNFWMIFLGIALFYNADNPLFPSAWKSLAGKVVVGLTGVMPGLNFVGLWDDYLSASLYSGKPTQALIVFTSDAKVPRSITPYLSHIGIERSLDVSRWAVADLNVPPYPEVRVYQAVGRWFESQGVPEHQFQLFVTEPLKGPAYRPESIR